jgi:long-chain acyl-CoA synthetase
MERARPETAAMTFTPRFTTLVDVFENSMREFAARELFGTKANGRWTWTTYGEFGEMVGKLRGGLSSIGIERGDRVAIIANNRLEWAVAAYACYGLGAVFVPMYEAQSPKEWEFILRDCEARALLVANERVAEKAKYLLDRDGGPGVPLRKLVVIDAGDRTTKPGARNGDGAHDDRIGSFADLLASGVEAASIHPSPEDTAALIYTSGTMGTPKGVVLSHMNLASNVSSIHELFHFSPEDRSLAFLPWSHVFGQVAELHLLISFGSSMAICEGPDKILENLAEVRPTVLFSVPRVFNRLYTAVNQQLSAKPKIVQRMVAAALAVSAKKRDGYKPKFYEVALLRLVDKIVFDKVRARFGGRLFFTVSGSAALSQEVGAFIDSLGILVYEGYGLTETSPVVSVNVPGARKMGTVGRPIPGCRVQIDPTPVVDRSADGNGGRIEGEIVVYGPNVMRGYYNRPADTAEALTNDGGVRTGDMGFVDGDGFLSITGRIKEQYKLENGKYVVPTPIEEQIKLSPYVANVLVYGDNKPYNVALIVANMPAITKWSQGEQIALPNDANAVLVDPRVRALFKKELERLASGFKGYESIRDFALIATDFTTDNGMLTPKMSLKRRRVIEVYGSLFDQLYGAARKEGSRAASAS